MKKRNVLADLVFAAGCEAPVLITHPSDLSREAYARFIHDHSSLRPDPFIAIFCGDGLDAGPMPALVRITFERIRRGTLFLDGIDELDAPTQTELVPLLGGHVSRAPTCTAGSPSQLRLIAGSREPLPPMVEEGRFSAALLSRLAVIQITDDMPAGRDHKGVF